MIMRLLFRAADRALDVAEGAVRRARAWVDLHYPPQDIDELIDELIAEFEQLEKAQRRIHDEHRSFSESFDSSWDNVVHLPRGARR